MKKILALLLAVCCIFAVASCKDDSSEPAGATAEQVSAIANVINSSNPTSIVTITEYAYGEDVYKGMFETKIDKNPEKSVFTFSYARPARVEDASESNTVTVAGTVYYNKGQVSVNDGDSWVAAGSGYVELDISLEASKLKSYTVSEDGGTLTATATAENAKRILGTTVSAEGDVTIVITTNSVYLYNVRVTYTAKDTGASVVIDTSYDYRVNTLEFPGKSE